MDYREHDVGPALRPWVRCLWELRGGRAPGEPAALERVLPDGCAELVFHLGDPFECVARDGALRRQACALFAGVATEAVVLAPSRRADVVGVRFQPGGAVLLTDEPLERWTDVIAPADSLEDRDTQELHERLAAARPGRERALLLERFLHVRVRTARRTPLHAAASLLASGHGSVAGLARGLGMSARQLQRRFRSEVGVGPKLLARIARLQHAVQLAQRPTRPSLTAVAHAAGYADQAHFSREFRGFSGLTPRAFLRATHPLTDAFAGGAR